MTYLLLFWEFFKIGLFTIGGGYSMIPMIKQTVIDGYGWLTEEQLLDFIGVAESTPGPIALNLATFIGNAQGGLGGNIWGGFFGAVCATFGVVLPSFIIILIIAIAFEKLINTAAVQGFFYGVRPVVVGLVVASAITFGLSVVLPLVNLTYLKNPDFSKFDYVSLILIIALFVLAKLKFGKNKKTLHPIFLVLIAASAGILLFGVLGL